MSEKSEALRLAEVLDLLWMDGQTPRQAAAELRRLDAECNDLAHQLNQSNERNGRLIAQRDAIQQVVDEQAEDEGLWFRAETAAEAYLQQELRRLHAAVEGAARAAIKAVEGEKA